MLRPLKRQDIAELLPIENMVHIAPWTRETFQSCFDMGCIGWVSLDEAKQITGFVILSMRVDECHVLNVCVRRSSQRQGVGLALMEKAIQHCLAEKTQVIYLEVRRTNFAAIALYTRLGFQQIGERKGYYPTVAGSEDALIFAKLLSV